MNILFKIQDGQKNVGQSDFVDHYGNINYSMSWAKLLPNIKAATNLFIKPILGEFYNELAANFQGGTLSPKEIEVVEILKDAIARYTILMQSNTAGANLSELGLINHSDKEGTTQSISQWQYRNIVWNLTKTADSFFDSALSFVYQNNDYFQIEMEGETLLINTAAELSKHISTKGSYRAFLAMKPFIRKAQELYIKDILGNLFDELITAIEENTLSDIQKQLLDKTQAVLAEYALNISIPQLSIDLTGGQITVLSESDGLKKYETANDSKLESLAVQTERFATIQQKKLLAFLASNKVEFGITSPVSEKTQIINHGGSVGIFSK